MSQKQRSIVLPIIAVIALGIGTFAGLTEGQINTLKEALETIAAAGFTLYGLYGVWKSHDKEKGGQS